MEDKLTNRQFSENVIQILLQVDEVKDRFSLNQLSSGPRRLLQKPSMKRTIKAAFTFLAAKFYS